MSNETPKKLSWLERLKLQQQQKEAAEAEARHSLAVEADQTTVVEEKVETIIEQVPEPPVVEEKIEKVIEQVPEPPVVEEKIEKVIEKVSEAPPVVEEETKAPAKNSFLEKLMAKEKEEGFESYATSHEEEIVSESEEVVIEPEPEPEPEPEAEPEENKGGFFSKFLGRSKNKEELKEDLDQGLKKSNDSIFAKLSKAVAGRTEIDIDVLDDIEQALVESDINIDTTIKIIERLEARAATDKYVSVKEVYSMLSEEIIDLLTENNTPDYTDFSPPDTGDLPYVLLVVGVNGVGKTTTIGKLAYQFKKQGKSVVLGAADTFRAAAVEQLTIWSERVDVPIVKQGMGSDPAAVAFDTAQSAHSKDFDIAIIDTAGRLHNKKHLMDELSKIKRVMKKVHPDYPHDVLLVLDGSTGQNALMQADAFTKATEVTSIAVTKLDGTAKGGAVIAIADQFKVPIKYIGVGEGMEHLQVFNKKEFVDSLFKR